MNDWIKITPVSEAKPCCLIHLAKECQVLLKRDGDKFTCSGCQRVWVRKGEEIVLASSNGQQEVSHGC